MASVSAHGSEQLTRKGAGLKWRHTSNSDRADEATAAWRLPWPPSRPTACGRSTEPHPLSASRSSSSDGSSTSLPSSLLSAEADAGCCPFSSGAAAAADASLPPDASCAPEGLNRGGVAVLVDLTRCAAGEVAGLGRGSKPSLPSEASESELSVMLIFCRGWRPPLPLAAG